MSSLRPLRIWWLLPLLAAFAVAADLAVTLLQQASKAGTAELWMLLWTLAFVLMLPLLLLMLSVAGRLEDSWRHRQTIPLVGEKIPDLGQ